MRLFRQSGEKVVQRRKDPESIEAWLVELAKSEPETFPLQVILSRELPTGDVEAIAEPPSVAETEPADERSPENAEEDAHFVRHGVNPPGDPWTQTVAEVAKTFGHFAMPDETLGEFRYPKIKLCVAKRHSMKT